jgi:hypothetical protein
VGVGLRQVNKAVTGVAPVAAAAARPSYFQLVAGVCIALEGGGAGRAAESCLRQHDAKQWGR